MKQYRSQKRQNEKIKTIYNKEELGSGDTNGTKHKRQIYKKHYMAEKKRKGTM